MSKKTKATAKPITPPPVRLRKRARQCAEQALEHAKTKPVWDDRLYSALAGEAAPPKEAFQACMIGPRVRAATVVPEELWRYMQEKPLARAALITITLPDATDLNDIYLNVLQSRKIKGDLEKSGILHVIGMHQLRSRPANNAFRCEIHTILTLIAYGEGVDEATLAKFEDRLDGRYSRRSSEHMMECQHLDRTEDAIAAAAAQLFDMSEGPRKALLKQAKAMGIKSWTKGRPKREFCRFHALASVAFKPMCFATGDGERLLDKAIVEGKHLLKPLWKAEQILHRDQIAQFSAAELTRLGMTSFRLPFIRVR